MSEDRIILETAGVPASGLSGRKYRAGLIAAGELRGHGLAIGREALAASVQAFAGANCLLNHVALFGAADVRDLAGVWSDLLFDGQAITGTLEIKATPAGDVAIRLLDQLVADQAAGSPSLDVGVSLDCWVRFNDTGDEILEIVRVSSADLVFRPASDGARFTHILASAGIAPAPAVEEVITMTAPNQEAGQPQADQYLAALAQSTLAARLAASNLPAPAQEAVTSRFAGAIPSVTEIDQAIGEQQRLVAALTPAVQGHDRPHDVRMTAPIDHAQAIADWMFGVRSAPLPEPSMRRPSDFYRAFTGDIDWHGRYSADRAQFAAGTTANLSDLAANAMNKVLVEAWPALVGYRWYERLVTVAPNDGSVQAMAWVTFGGIANLPTVAEGAAYTEASVGDVSESDAFAKYGAYVGITEEMFRNDNLAKMQAVPRALAAAAVRTRSAKIAAIFTTASGTGPTLDQDSTVLFHSNHGSNVQTTALSAAAWEAARLECYKHSEVNSSKRLGLFPKFCLVPADLYDDALVFFGYGTGGGGYPGTGNNDTNPYGVGREDWDPRPVPIAVPDWTDANDWAYLVEPALHPVLMISYAQQPGGGGHALPEIFSVSSPLAGLVFANDTLPVKVRDWFSYGVATWRGIGKRNVT